MIYSQLFGKCGKRSNKKKANALVNIKLKRIQILTLSVQRSAQTLLSAG